MLNIVVINCDGKYIEYEWDSIESFIKDMKSNNENIPMLDDILAEVNTDNDNLQSWWRNVDGMTVNDLVNKCKRRAFREVDIMEQLLKYVEELNTNTPDGQIVDADTILKDIMDEQDFEVSGIAQDIFNIYHKSSDKQAVKEMFFEFTGMEFDQYLMKCRREITRK